MSLATFTLVSLSPIDPVQANVGQQALLGMSEAKRARLAEHWGSGVPLHAREKAVEAMEGDAPLLVGIALFCAVLVFAGNLLADILARVIDPRVGGEVGHGIR